MVLPTVVIYAPKAHIPVRLSQKKWGAQLVMHAQQGKQHQYQQQQTVIALVQKRAQTAQVWQVGIHLISPAQLRIMSALSTLVVPDTIKRVQQV